MISPIGEVFSISQIYMNLEMHIITSTNKDWIILKKYVNNFSSHELQLESRDTEKIF